jgi:hypothetical protein
MSTLTLDNPADQIVDALIVRAESGMETIVAELEEKLRAAVSVPVGHTGNVVIRSLPGESPREEFGDYEGSFGHATATEGDVVRGAAGTTSERGPWFEGGTTKMKPRPHFGKVRDEFAETAVERVVQALSNP